MIRLALVGSTCLEGDRDAERAVLEAISEWRKRDSGLVIVSGGAAGVDTIAEKIATHLGIPTTIHRPRGQRWGGDHGYQARNRLIADTCTHLLRVYCVGSETWGSGWTQREARKLGRIIVPQVELLCAGHDARPARRA